MEIASQDYFKGKKVLVTGGTGTIGSVLVQKLLVQGANVSVVSLDTESRAKAVLGDLSIFQRGDLRDYQICLDIANDQECVFHLMAVKGSAKSGLAKVASAYVPFLLCNTNMMEAAFRQGVSRYMFVGSIGEYPPLALRREDDVWNGAPEANDRYMGIAKRAGEAQGETYLHEFGWDAVRIVRFSNVYGPFDDFDPETAQVIPALIHRAMHGERPLKVAGDGSAVRDFIYSDDAVRGMMIAMEKAPPCVPINIGSGVGVTIRELAETIADLAPHKPKVVFEGGGQTGDSVRILAVERARELLGYRAEISLREGLGKTMQWYSANRDIADRRGKELHGETQPKNNK